MKHFIQPFKYINIYVVTMIVTDHYEINFRQILKKTPAGLCRLGPTQVRGLTRSDQSPFSVTPVGLKNLDPSQ